MKRPLLLGALLLAVLVPVAAAAPAATGTLRGTVIAKDRSHHALVVARPGGKVQMLVAPAAYARVGIGRTVVARTTSVTGQLPVAVSISVKGRAHKAVVQGTVVRLSGRQAVISAGGSLLRITLARSGRRALSSATSGPRIGDDVKVEVEIDDDGSLDAGAVVVRADASKDAGSGGELEVRGTVTALTPATTAVAGSITVAARGVPVTCVIPLGVTLSVAIGDPIELECDLVGDPGVWTVHVAKSEDEQGEDEDEGDHSGPGHDDSTEVEVRGTIAAPFLLTSTSVTVTPRDGGAAVTCTIVAGSLPRFAAGDSVKMECLEVGDTLKLKEIEKSDDDSGETHHGEGGHDDGDGGHDDGDGGGHHGGGDGGQGKD